MTALYLVSVGLHVLAACLWVGGMVFLALVLVPVLRTPELAPHAVVAVRTVGLRYRAVGWITLLTLVVTGTVNAGFRAGSWSALGDAAWWSSPFGRVLAVKLGLVGFVLALSAAHDFWIGPRASALLVEEPGSPRARAFRRAASLMGRVNLACALLILALAIVLVRGLP